MDIYTYLTSHTIEYQRFDHPAVFTCEESALLPDMPGANTKNLFLRNKKGTEYFLVSVGHSKQVDLKALSKLLDKGNLSFGSEDRLMEYLQLTPGSVTILGLIHDPDHHVELILDEEIWNAESVLCHPLINTATLSISHENLEKFLDATGHKAMVIEVPSKIEN